MQWALVEQAEVGRPPVRAAEIAEQPRAAGWHPFGHLDPAFRDQRPQAVQRRAPNANSGADALTSITPRQVWDDGTFTYFKFRSNGEMPSIFSVSAGRERSVNSQTMNDGTVRVSGTSPYWVLRVGDIENTIAMMGAVK